MSEIKLHGLLERQLEKANIDDNARNQMQDFLALVSESYDSLQKDFVFLENVLEQSSKELYLANQQLRTKVKTIESKLTKVATNIKDVIFEMDIDGNWTYLNSAWEKFTGVSVQESLGRKYHEFLPMGKELTSLLKEKHINASLEDEMQRVEFEFVKRPGKVLLLDFSIKPVTNAKDEIEGYIGTISDITEIKKTEKKLILAREKEIKANKAKDQFLTVMSHEIRTPLNAVIGVSNLLLMEDPKESQMDNLNVLRHSSKHLLALVNDILDYNKIISGSIALEDDDFSLKEVLNAQQQIFHQKAAMKGIEFKLDVHPKVPEMVKGDTLRLNQILTNLIGNAIKFTDEGKVAIEVSLADQNAGLNQICFKISDTGIGIAKNKLNVIFQPFAQANSNTTRLYGGTGLGLNISKKLVEIMGGDLKCESKLGSGSEFYFTLPFKESENKLDKEEFDNLNFSKDKKSASLAGAKVLIVEDNRVNITIVKKFLSKWDVDCDIAENGLIGFEMSAKKVYNLILMDIEMPIMNGIQTTLGIRESNSNPNRETPIIAFTASIGESTNAEFRKCGMDGVLHKPFNPNDLYNTIKSCMATINGDYGISVKQNQD